MASIRNHNSVNKRQKDIKVATAKLQKDLSNTRLIAQNLQHQDLSKVSESQIKSFLKLTDQMQKGEQSFSSKDIANLEQMRANLDDAAQQMLAINKNYELELSDILNSYDTILHDPKSSVKLRNQKFEQLKTIVKAGGGNIDHIKSASALGDSNTFKGVADQLKGKRISASRLSKIAPDSVFSSPDPNQRSVLRRVANRGLQATLGGIKGATSFAAQGALGATFGAIGLGHVDSHFGLSTRIHSYGSDKLNDLFSKDRTGYEAITHDRHDNFDKVNSLKHLQNFMGDSKNPKRSSPASQTQAAQPENDQQEPTPTGKPPRKTRRKPNGNIPSSDDTITVLKEIVTTNKDINSTLTGTNSKLDELITNLSPGHRQDLDSFDRKINNPEEKAATGNAGSAASHSDDKEKTTSGIWDSVKKYIPSAAALAPIAVPLAGGLAIAGAGAALDQKYNPLSDPKLTDDDRKAAVDGFKKQSWKNFLSFGVLDKEHGLGMDEESQKQPEQTPAPISPVSNASPSPNRPSITNDENYPVTTPRFPNLPPNPQAINQPARSIERAPVSVNPAVGRVNASEVTGLNSVTTTIRNLDDTLQQLIQVLRSGVSFGGGGPGSGGGNAAAGGGSGGGATGSAGSGLGSMNYSITPKSGGGGGSGGSSSPSTPSLTPEQTAKLTESNAQLGYAQAQASLHGEDPNGTIMKGISGQIAANNSQLTGGSGGSSTPSSGGSVATKGNGTRSWRNNNPGNIEYGKYSKGMGAVGSDGRFAIFPTYEAGRKAQQHLLFESGTYKNLTLGQAISKWAPGSENNVPAYIKAMGADPNKKMSEFTPEQQGKLLDAMQSHEGYRQGAQKAQGTTDGPSTNVPSKPDSAMVGKGGDSGGGGASASTDSKPAGNVSGYGGAVPELKASPGRRPDMANVDPRLREIMAAAQTHLPPGYTVGVNEGYNPNGHVANSQHHIKGVGALDVAIRDPQGKVIPNEGADPTGMYHMLGKAANGEMLARYPELKDKLNSGIFFGASRTNSAADLMHWDLGGRKGITQQTQSLGTLPDFKPENVNKPGTVAEKDTSVNSPENKALASRNTGAATDTPVPLAARSFGDYLKTGGVSPKRVTDDLKVNDIDKIRGDETKVDAVYKKNDDTKAVIGDLVYHGSHGPIGRASTPDYSNARPSHGPSGRPWFENQRVKDDDFRKDSPLLPRTFTDQRTKDDSYSRDFKDQKTKDDFYMSPAGQGGVGSDHVASFNAGVESRIKELREINKLPGIGKGGIGSDYVSGFNASVDEVLRQRTLRKYPGAKGIGSDFAADHNARAEAYVDQWKTLRPLSRVGQGGIGSDNVADFNAKVSDLVIKDQQGGVGSDTVATAQEFERNRRAGEQSVQNQRNSDAAEANHHSIMMAQQAGEDRASRPGAKVTPVAVPEVKTSSTSAANMYKAYDTAPVKDKAPVAPVEQKAVPLPPERPVTSSEMDTAQMRRHPASPSSDGHHKKKPSKHINDMMLHALNQRMFHHHTT